MKKREIQKNTRKTKKKQKKEILGTKNKYLTKIIMKNHKNKQLSHNEKR